MSPLLVMSLAFIAVTVAVVAALATILRRRRPDGRAGSGSGEES